MKSLFSTLTKTRDFLGKKILGLFGAGKININIQGDLEDILLSADFGYKTTNYIIKEIQKRSSLSGLGNHAELNQHLQDILFEILSKSESTTNSLFLDKYNTQEPYVIMLIGINGAGKTTTIGKLAHFYKSHNKTILLGSGDTFRAAAREQLSTWGQRNNIMVLESNTQDVAAVCFDAVNTAMKQKIDVAILDTAGRLPTQSNLIEELRKAKRATNKALDSAPHEIMLVLDATIGQNSIAQIKAFNDAVQVDSIALTKLDGTSKGGAIVAIAMEYQLPIRFIGTGESIDDLQVFNAKDFITNIFLNK